MDIRVIEALDVLPVTKLDATSIIPLELAVTGRGFQHAQKAFINGLALDPVSAASPYGMVVISDTQIRLIAPEALWGSVINSVTILGENIVALRESTDVSFTFKGFRQVTGISKAFQQFLKLLLTSPGTDLFNPGLGGGLGRPVGMPITNENAQGMASKVHVAVKKCVQDIRKSQQGLQIPQEEKLLNVIVTSVNFSKENTELQVGMEFQTYAGAAIVSVGV